MKIVHVADVHLDRPFVGLPSAVGAGQRRRLLETFNRVLALARDRSADLLTIGGDLWEEEHVHADTRASVAHALGQLGIPTLIVCGNHDRLIAGGSYRRTTWPSNVEIVPIRRLYRFDYDDVTVWSVSWGGGDLPSAVLDHLDISDDGRAHVALLHGTAPTAPFAEETESYFPFDPEKLRVAGIDLVLAGHIHAASFENGVVYPGSPEPLHWGEPGRHCAAVVDIEGKELDVELVDVNQSQFTTMDIDCTGCESSAEIADRLRAIVGDTDTFVRIRLTGEVGPDCAVDRSTLGLGGFAHVAVVDRTEPRLDVEGRLERKSLDGEFARRLVERVDAAADERAKRIAELALEAGLRALEGRDEVLRVG